mmetsp:Transcript_94962/g.306602  ORF Transcript_94962/g.306602 Transcript_94962/m.306602 type:complete len:228 (-) Transcript_94962:129-812(-)
MAALAALPNAMHVPCLLRSSSGLRSASAQWVEPRKADEYQPGTDFLAVLSMPLQDDPPETAASCLGSWELGDSPLQKPHMFEPQEITTSTSPAKDMPRSVPPPTACRAQLGLPLPDDSCPGEGRSAPFATEKVPVRLSMLLPDDVMGAGALPAAAPVPGPPPPHDQAVWSWVVSCGSIGHPHCCAEPCKYATKKRGCKDGAACKRCHICIWKRYEVVRRAPQLGMPR